jgi:predicted metal-dependent phosphoesterase TrpH
VNTYRCLFHVHTRVSFDSLLSPKTIVASARRLGVHALVVTDHNSIQGSLDVQHIAKGNPPLVITSAEYQSEKGDIIGLFLKEEICSRRSAEIIEQIHRQDGLVVLPHPYKGHLLDEGFLAGVDLIETHNSRCHDSDNQRATELAQRYGRPAIAGADAHCSRELNTALNEFLIDPPGSTAEFQEHLKIADRRVITRKSPAVCRPYSQMIKAARTRNPGLFFYQMKRLALVLARAEKK